MSFKKTMLAVATVGAITAGSAVPAMALENIFNGMFRLKGDFTNFDLNGGNDATLKGTAAAGTPQTQLRKNAPTYFYVEQRARIYYTAKANDDLKLITAFEIDSRWGDTAQNSSVTRNVGGAIEADQVNIETKNVYLDFNIPKAPVNIKAGILPYMDSYKGIFLNADIASVLGTYKKDNLTTTLGWSRAYDNRNPYGSTAVTATAPYSPFNPAGGYSGGGVGVPGKFSLDVTTLDAKYTVSKNLLVGGTYYMTWDSNMSGHGTNVLHTFGINAAGNVGIATLSGFVMAQTGDTPTTNNFQGALYSKVGNHTTAYAANVAAKVKVTSDVTLRSSFLYTSGDHGNGKNNKAWQGVNQFTNGSSTNQTTNYADGQMTMLMETTKYAANTDRSLIYTSSNNDQGIIAGFLGVDYVTGKLFANANLGIGAVAAQNGAKPLNLLTGGTNTSDVIGTEINAEVGYKLFDNLSASLVGGYVFLGDYYKDTATRYPNTATVTAANKAFIVGTPDNPWKTQIVLNYAF